jgi:hypothetical protein
MDALTQPDFPKVVGYCPMGCGETLFLSEGGYVTCSWHACLAPDRASGVLRDPRPDEPDWQALAGKLAEGLVGLAEMIDEYGQDSHGGSEPDESDPLCHLWNAAEAIKADPTDISTHLYAEHGPRDEDEAEQAVILAGHAIARYHEAAAQPGGEER